MRKYLIYLLVLFGGAILTQSFQCASMNVSSAKNKIKQGKYDEAITLLNKELTVNPGSEDALNMLFDVYGQNNQPEKQFETLEKLEKVAKDPKVKKQLPYKKYQFWFSCYQNSIDFYKNRDKNPKSLDTALTYANMGIKLKPYSNVLYPVKSTIYSAKGDEKQAAKVYEEYVETIKPSLNFMEENKIYLKSTRSHNIDILGQPKDTKSSLKNGTQDTMITDLYVIDGKEIYLGYDKDRNADNAYFSSLKYDIPKDFPEEDRYSLEPFNIDPLTSLAFNNYQDKNYDQAIKYVELALKANPNDEKLNTMVISFYQSAGKTDVVINKLKDRIKENPQDYKARTTYAGFILNAGKTEEAIYNYKQALSIKPDYDFALRNLGSAYKNLAADLQKKETDKADADPNYKMDLTETLEMLEQSAEYLEKALKSDKYKDDYNLLSDLLNIYDIQGKQDKINTYLSKLEKMESDISDPTEKEQYYLQLYKIYTSVGEKEKAKEIQKKLGY